MRIPVPALVSLFVISFLVDFYIRMDLKSYSSADRRKLYTRIYAVLSGACWIFLTVIACLPLRDEANGVTTVMWMLFSYITVYLSKAIYCIFSLTGRLFSPRGHRKLNYGVMAGIPMSVICFITMWWGVVFTRHEIEVNKVEISSPRLPAGFGGLRIVQFSDLHVGTWGNDTTFVSALVDSINSCRPDLILFTGDIVNRRTEELEPFLPVLSRLNASRGVFSILGNHDYGDYIDWKNPADREANNRKFAEYQKMMGWTLLNNEHRFLLAGTDSIALIGVENWGDPPFKCYGHLERSYKEGGLETLNDSCYKILLTHNPAHWVEEVEPQTNIDLTLSGHTHAMQAMVTVGDWKWSPAKWRYDLWGGLYTNGANVPEYLYVNIGVGEVGIPSRIGAVPEVTLITLRRGENLTVPKAEK